MYTGEEGQVWKEIDMRAAFSKQLGNFNQQVGTDSLDFADLYAQWLDCRKLAPGQLRLLPKRIEQWPSLPRIVPVIFCNEDDDHALLVTSLGSLTGQSYPSQVLIVGPASMRPLAPDAQHIIRRGDDFAQINHWLAASNDQAEWIYLLRALSACMSTPW